MKKRNKRGDFNREIRKNLNQRLIFRGELLGIGGVYLHCLDCREVVMHRYHPAPRQALPIGCQKATIFMYMDEFKPYKYKL